MVTTLNNVSSLNNPLSFIETGIKECIYISGQFITSIDGLYYISELVLSIFEMAEKLGREISATFQKTVTVFKGYLDLTSAFELVNRIVEWTSKDKHGLYIWERPFPSLIYNSFLTFSDFTNLLYLLDNFKLITLGGFATSVNVAYTVSTLGTCVFDAWDNYNKSEKAQIKSGLADLKVRQWEVLKTISIDDFHAYATGKIQKWEARNRPSKMHDWLLLSRCMHPNEIRDLCDLKVRKWEVAKTNYDNKIFKCWCTIACDIGYIALLIFGSIVQLFMLKELLIAAAALCVVVNVMYVANFIIDTVLSKKALPEANLPASGAYCI